MGERQNEEGEMSFEFKNETRRRGVALRLEDREKMSQMSFNNLI